RNHPVVDARAAAAQHFLDPRDDLGLLAQELVGHHHRALDPEPLELEPELAHGARAEHDARRLKEAELKIARVHRHSSRNLVGTDCVASTSALDAATKRTIRVI